MAAGQSMGREELERLRAIAEERVRTTPLSALAAFFSRTEYIGSLRLIDGPISAAQLREFLDYSPDHARTRLASVPPADTAPEGAGDGDVPQPAAEMEGGEAQIFGALLRDIPAQRRHCAVVRLLGTLAAVYRECNVALPQWFTEAALTACPDV